MTIPGDGSEINNINRLQVTTGGKGVYHGLPASPCSNLRRL